MLWALSCYFNPSRYKKKLENFRVFRQALGAPLIVVELVYEDQPELTAADADRLLQIRGRDILWQKERLLNLALREVPKECAAVAWLDCDILFERPDWVARTEEALADAALVQLFSEIYELPRDYDPASQPLERSSAAYAGSGIARQWLDAGERKRVFAQDAGMRSSGLAWAARRELLESCGFYDRCILGGGDRALAAAAVGDFDAPAAAWRWNIAQRRDFERWAVRYYAAVRCRIGCVEGAVFHLWHGRARDRCYRQRLLDLAGFGFDPERDIAIDAGGCWRWSSSKPDLHAYAARYFAERREDG